MNFHELSLSTAFISDTRHNETSNFLAKLFASICYSHSESKKLFLGPSIKLWEPLINNSCEFTNEYRSAWKLCHARTIGSCFSQFNVILIACGKFQLEISFSVCVWNKLKALRGSFNNSETIRTISSFVFQIYVISLERFEIYCLIGAWQKLELAATGLVEFSIRFFAKWAYCCINVFWPLSVIRIYCKKRIDNVNSVRSFLLTLT